MDFHHRTRTCPSYAKTAGYAPAVLFIYVYLFFLLRFPVYPYHLPAVLAFQLYYDYPETGFPNVADPLPALFIRAFHFPDTYHLLS